MTIREALNTAAKKLQNKSTSPQLDAEVLLCFVLKKPKEYLHINSNNNLLRNMLRIYFLSIRKRSEGLPVAYLTGEREFYGLKFYVDKNVLIPRPETEGLVELAIKYIGSKKNLKILDVGTGSGNIIIIMAKKLGSKNLYFASDISPTALKVTKKNTKLHKVKIKFANGSLLKPWDSQKFDVIIANLPYLEKRTDPSTKFEPTGALIADKKGLKLYEDLFKQMSNKKMQPKYIFLEIGHHHGQAIKKLATKYLPAFQIKIYKDLSGFERFAVLQPITYNP